MDSQQPPRPGVPDAVRAVEPGPNGGKIGADAYLGIRPNTVEIVMVPGKAYSIRGGAAGRERLRILSRVMSPSTASLFDR
jgi:hypothetical protein